MTLSDSIRILGWASIVGGFIIGIVTANASDPMMEALTRSYDSAFQWSVFISWVVAGVTCGVIFLAIEKALGLLEEIAHNTKQQALATTTATHSNVRTTYPETGLAGKKSSLESLSSDYKFKSNDG
ncbi:hypothetical protein K0T92_11460 [Paenibacillus oenotherae]|uniref:Uncharacterized protein n=1 Tax=Paenibacillus oenotherae TaxID=1435645 RepID=A0ABS7D5Z2_9BACL|nr:hypothetical protein [Paenibacillus oenotherae]MBW7475367.1 hypothetical protein [Paenibacillus oenotherae]